MPTKPAAHNAAHECYREQAQLACWLLYQHEQYTSGRLSAERLGRLLEPPRVLRGRLALRRALRERLALLQALRERLELLARPRLPALGAMGPLSPLVGS